ncbi:MAG: radical SAM family heme chaperone HemW [Gammaproteobacteria bacterium]|nr:MAG: radical SAM family heme chaperone HemW [Gammaproteobacteria bacterium]
MHNKESIGLYIHLPWCIRKCPYCDFNSHPLHNELPEAIYAKALTSDLVFEAEKLNDRTVHSIFFGGGTPSLFSDHAIGKILDTIVKHFSVPNDAEISLEANPGTAEIEYFKGYHSAGINRLSLGVQSLNDDMLERLGRIHNSKESLHAYDVARQAGFENINLDIMFGLPEQDLQQAVSDLRSAISLQAEHLSWYQLTLEPNTAFAYSPPQLPDNDTCANIHELGIDLLEERGLQRYEISAFAQPGYQCRHNLTYWQFGDYLGIGAGAHGKLTTDQITRFSKVRHPKEYMQKAGSADAYHDIKQIKDSELLFEFLLNQLRLTEGFHLDALQSETGISAKSLLDQLPRAFEDGLLMIDGNTCRTTKTGIRFLNEILLGVLPEKC